MAPSGLNADFPVTRNTLEKTSHATSDSILSGIFCDTFLFE
jgi:hypothetical protein